MKITGHHHPGFEDTRNRQAIYLDPNFGWLTQYNFYQIKVATLNLFRSLS